jgi:predicted protein tyrosine phosphatase
MSIFNKIVYNILCATRNRKCLDVISKIGNIDNYNVIIPNIYLGNLNCANDVNFLKNNNIQAIINCTEQEPFNEYFIDKSKFRLSVNDSKEEDNINKFKDDIIDAIEFIDKNMEENKILYIHCYWGLMRSATVVAGYLIMKYKLDYESAIELVKEQRPKALSSIYNFNEVLKFVDNKYNKNVKETKI